MPEPVRVRFSPAPTGSLHVGSARTALFNWLFARHTGGSFLLRIEDTDLSRSGETSAAGIEDTLHWLGLEWDEPVVRQSQRFAEYRAAAAQLLDEGRAYACYCTPEEIKGRNDAAVAAGRSPGYDGHCRDLSEAEQRRLAAEGRPRTLRFRTPDAGASAFIDLIRGEVRVEWATVADFVILRSDDTPLFFLANAVDDLEMGITHVIRGEDLLDSTHRVLAIRAALSPTPPPQFAHLPLIVGQDRAKLSKRHGAVALEELRAAGYLREALRNYLALLGWAPDDGRELLDADELVSAFTLDRVTHAAAAFDYDKLGWLNGEWIRRLTLPELEAAALPLARERFGETLDPVLLRRALELGQPRATTLGALLDQADFLFVPDDEFRVSPEAWAELKTDRVDDILAAVESHLAAHDWGEPVDLRAVIESLGLKPRQAMPVVYTAIEGRRAGLPVFESIDLLGRERSLRRVRAARERPS
ncbi:MAG TPA: glutamate--tRNA ligase [Acidimicrobiia bacterium]|nr:glutamate--tRNA ligase [Acidimicrobiia bacterium]